MPQFVRQTAVPCTLGEIASGQWIQNDGMLPSGVKTNRGLISRASVIGVVIDKEEASFSIDDGTRVIGVRSFDAKPVPVLASVGDIVLVIGRPREYNGERYLVLEICKRVRNSGWIQYRRKELECFIGTPLPVEAQTPVQAPPIQPIATGKNPYETLVEKIRELDTGSGVQIDDLLQTLPDAEKFIRTLIEEGEVFEIKPGRLKVLE